MPDSDVETVKAPATSRCGTYAGYQAHKRRGEPACAPCREGNRVYVSEYRAANSAARESEKVRNSARSKALARLGRENRERLRQLYLDELTKAKETSR